MGGGPSPTKSTKTIVVLGAAYGGVRAAQILAAGIPEGWRIILVDRNSHANHVYVMPRFAVLAGHEFKAFIPYKNVFLHPTPHPHIVLKAHVESIRPTHVTLSRSFPEYGLDKEIPFDYAVYALGSHMPSPLNLWGCPPDKSDLTSPSKEEEKKDEGYEYGGTKLEAISWLQQRQKLIKKAESVLVVGGGALGVQFATDIKAIHPSKNVTLLHSRDRLLPRFDKEMHDQIRKYTDEAGITLILGERLDLSSLETSGQAKLNASGRRVVRTEKGREIEADLLLLCTGQTPNTALLSTLDPTLVDEKTKLVKVLRTLQVGVPVPEDDVAEKVAGIALDFAAEVKGEGEGEGEKKEKNEEEIGSSPYPHIFAIGDAADAFGAIAAGHCAYNQGEVAARNIIRLIKNASLPSGAEPEELERYAPGPKGIKVSLGLHKAIYQLGAQVGSTEDCKDDLMAPAIWPYFGIKVEKEEDMYE